jgi:hypothetical protein
MNAFGLANHGKGLTAKQICEAMEDIYVKADELFKRQEASNTPKPIAKSASFVPEIEL